MRKLTLLIAIAAISLVGPTLADDALLVPSFTEETAIAGIDSIYAGQWQYMVGGGAATFDCNDDGYPDMLLAGGEGRAKFYRNTSKQGGALSFTADASGLKMDAVTGAYPLDIDGDGIEDLVLLRVGEAIVMRGLGQCKFEPANAAWNFDGGDKWWTAFSATWEKGATWPTLALGSYIDRTQDIDPWGSCTDNWLERPAADGKAFTAPVPLKPSFCSLSMLFTDWNRSGTPSLRVSNDREYYLGGTEQLWHVDPGQDPTPYTAAEGWKPLKIWGMGIANADVTGDGYPDYFLTSMADNKLQTLASPPIDGVVKPDFKDVAFPRNAIAQHPYTGGDVRPSTAWHAQFEDVNNDGLDDLFVAKGNVSTMPDFAAHDPNNLMLQGADGQFIEVGDHAGIASMEVSRGAALTDFNLDGLMDLVVVNRWTNAQIWRNTTVASNKWIAFRLAEPDANRDAVGAWIEVRTGDKVQQREITVGGGHAGGQMGWWHFGLGAADAADVRINWPDGTSSDWSPVTPEAFYVIEKGKAPAAWSPAS